MSNNHKYPIKHISQTLNENNSLANLISTCHEIDEINQILSKNIPNILNLCKCGAIDYPANTLVLFSHDNASYYKVNNLVTEIEQVLQSNTIIFDRILVKLTPNIRQKATIKPIEFDEKKFQALQHMIEVLGLDYNLKKKKKIEDTSSDEWIKL